MRVVNAPGILGTFSGPPRVSDPDRHHGTCDTHVPWCMPVSLISSFYISQWREKRPSIPGARMCNPQFYVSDNRPMAWAPLCELPLLSHHPAVKSALLHPPQFLMAMFLKSNHGWVRYRLISRQYTPCPDTAMNSQTIIEETPQSVGEASGILSNAGKLKWSIMKD